MRKRVERALLLVAFAALVLAAPAAAVDIGWTPQASGTTNDLSGVDVIATDFYYGWVVGSQGTILATSDGGATWVPQSSGTTSSLRGVDFIDASHGWAVGDQGTILVTANGGVSWTPQTSGTTNNLRGVDFIDASHGWAVGDQGTILATTDGGTTWTPQSSGTTSDLKGVGLESATSGWAVGNGGTILDWGLQLSGMVWTARNSGTTNDLQAVGILEGMSRAVGAGGTILWNGGYRNVWTAETSGTTVSLNSVAWSEPLSFPTVVRRGIVIGPSGWAVGDQGTILFTTAAGPWTQQASGTSNSLRDVNFINELQGWTVGDHGTILVTSTGGRETTAPTTTASGATDQHWYRTPRTITLTATDNVGGSGVAYTEFSLDGGSTWTKGTSIPLSEEGVHMLLYRSADVAGNVEVDKVLLLGIDTVKPSTRAPYAATATRGRTATLKYKVLDAEPNGGTAKVTIKVKNPAGSVVKTMKPVVKSVNMLLSWKFTVPRTWKKGTYRFYVYAADTAGNRQANVASNKLIVK